MEIDNETKEKIQEMQMYEQNFQNLMVKKQAFQIEFSETENALSEISKSKDEVFKMIWQIIIKTDKEKVEKELKQKKDLLSLRLKSIEKQESELTKEIEELKEDVMKRIK